MHPARTRLDTILLFDGIAIFFIVLYHALGGHPENPLIAVNAYTGILGLSLFTFSSGYKLMVNHADQVGQKGFLGEYYLRRFVRLYKPYIGYTVLMAFPLLLLSYCAVQIFHFHFPGLSVSHIISSMSIPGFVAFLCGNNPVAFQLWYLVILIIITSICFTILYVLDTDRLFLSFIPFLFLGALVQSGIVSNNTIIQVFTFLPFFISGCYWAYTRNQHRTANWSAVTRFFFPVLFILLILSSVFVQAARLQSILIYSGCFFFPFFLGSIHDQVKKMPLVYPFLLFCGGYSFQIYLFQWPLVLPVISRTTIDILHLDYVFMPVLVAIAAVYCSVLVYMVVRTVHLNGLFE